MAQKGPFPADRGRQTESEIETVLRQLVPASEPPAHASEPLAPAPEPPAPEPEPPAQHKWAYLARFRPGLKPLAVGAFLVVCGRCAYLEHQLSAVTNEAVLTQAEARACERRMQHQTPSDAADERSVRTDLDEVSHRIRGVGPIHESAPRVFTNRDPDPAEISPR